MPFKNAANEWIELYRFVGEKQFIIFENIDKYAWNINVYIAAIL